MRSLFITFVFALFFTLTVYAGAKLDFFALPSFTIVINLYMTFMTGSILWIIQKQNSPMLFSQAYLVSIVFKILTGLGLILVLSRLDPKGAFGNATLFVVSYIAFTAVEVACLLWKLRSERR